MQYIIRVGTEYLIGIRKWLKLDIAHLCIHQQLQQTQSQAQSQTRTRVRTHPVYVMSSVLVETARTTCGAF